MVYTITQVYKCNKETANLKDKYTLHTSLALGIPFYKEKKTTDYKFDNSRRKHH